MHPSVECYRGRTRRAVTPRVFRDSGYFATVRHSLHGLPPRSATSVVRIENGRRSSTPTSSAPPIRPRPGVAGRAERTVSLMCVFAAALGAQSVAMPPAPSARSSCAIVGSMTKSTSIVARTTQWKAVATEPVSKLHQRRTRGGVAHQARSAYAAIPTHSANARLTCSSISSST